MKKLLALLAVGVSVGIVGQAVAQTKGGFEGPGIQQYKISAALELKDDTPVILFGRIEKQLGDEKYLLNDGTGAIVVEIDDDEWNGLTVTPKMNLKVTGEIDRELLEKPEVDVSKVEEAKF